MAAIDKHVSGTLDTDHNGTLLAEIVTVWREFILTAFDPYHPERHYMRGPGPACRKKRESGGAR